MTKKELFSTTGFYLLLLSAAGVVAAYLSGENAGAGITEVGEPRLSLETREGAAELTLWPAIIAVVVRTAFKYHPKIFSYNKEKLRIAIIL